MLSDVLSRVEQRLKVLDISAAQASREAGLSEDAIRNLRRAVESDPNRKGVSTRTISALAPVLATTVGWLMSGEGEEEALMPLWPRQVPIVGYVGAGSAAHFYAVQQGELDYVDAPPGANELTKAAEVRGTSLGPLFERWLIYYDDVRTPVSPDLHGRLCIVGLPDDRILVKQIKPSKKTKGFYDLHSNNEAPIFDQEVLWAARVKTMTPR